MERRYHLSITLLLASTRGIQQELSFQSCVKISGEECRVHLRVHDGSMLSCEMRDAGGSLLVQHEEAIQRLKPLGMLEWHRTSSPFEHGEGSPEQQLVSWQRGPSLEARAEPIPVRLSINADLSTLDHVHRRVLLLVDGHRNVQQIAILLRKDPEEILAILAVLQGMSFVTF